MHSDRQLRRQVERVETHLNTRTTSPADGEAPVLFFNPSTRIHRLSINAAFSLLASWGVRWAGVPVRYLVCQRGMQQCILGTNRKDYAARPPCKHCIPFSRLLFPSELTLPLALDEMRIASIADELQHRSLDELIAWKYEGIPLGELCIPGLRWALRRHHLVDDDRVRMLFRQYLGSAASLAGQFNLLFERVKPKVLVVFNGISYPEAVARAIAIRKGIPVVTHEVGLQPYSAFFSYKDATFREIELSPESRLSQDEEEKLKAYLENRFQGQFTMAGIQFWPEMTSIPDWLKERMKGFRQIVPVFTNVIFDTSQIHANVLFEDMFAWLDALENVIRRHTDTLFVIRAHPDEDRPGKESQESVAEWFRKSPIRTQPNVVFFSPSEYVSSYDLIHSAKLVLVYNSSIGLEASIMEVPVLCAGRARYTQLATTFFPHDRKMYIEQLESLLQMEQIQVPSHFAENARRFLYFELYNASLDFSDFLRPYPGSTGMTLLTDFDPNLLGESPTMDVIRRSLLEGESFIGRSIG
jgi:hypothetical protein